MAAPIATSTTIALAALWCTCFQQYVEGHRKEGPLCPLEQVGDDANANKSGVRAYVRSCGRGVARNVYLGEHIPESKIFFGLWLVPLGYLAYKSEMFPKALGVMLIAGGACYLVGLLAVFLVPDSGETINTFVTLPSAVAEVSMVLYLLVIGVKTSPTT